MVIDMSAVGACVGLPRAGDSDYIDPEVIPDRVTLDIRYDASEVECEIAWRTESKLGLRFLSSPMPY